MRSDVVLLLVWMVVVTVGCAANGESGAESKPVQAGAEPAGEPLQASDFRAKPIGQLLPTRESDSCGVCLPLYHPKVC